ncbi:MAG: GTP-binding protein [Pygmaiobacter massiliensis]|uniref:TIGR03943 family putative permease subunit n=1 Tax=Pygmaiobacter massiliensis TaxID=1917873 RepID=UPI001FA877A2|nr:GTP-binding protein [Pygmaiobacter massiliensis]
MKTIPVYLFTGFLESGKTTFIQETLEDPRFSADEKTLLLLCEEGEVEFDLSKVPGGTVTVETIESKDELTQEYLRNLAAKSHADRVLVEYNGMWMLSDLLSNMPKNWQLYQNIMLADATTFPQYSLNMRSLVIDKAGPAEMIIFNRCADDVDRMELHRLVREASRRAEISYEAPDGTVDYDELEDPLPFDKEAELIKIADDDFGLWYTDITDNPQDYTGKRVQFKAQACQTPRVPKGCFAPGRFLMTCCVEDITFVGLVCKSETAASWHNREWITVTARVKQEYQAIYNGKGPVLVAESITPAEKAKNEVVTPY